MRLLRSLLLWALAVIVLAVLALPVTEPGTRLLVSAVQRFTPVELDYAGGTLAGELRLSRLAFSNPQLQLELLDVAARMAPACLWRSALCLHRLQIRELELRLLPADAEQDAVPPPRVDGAMLELPVPVEVAELDIGQGRIAWENGQWRQGRLQGSIRLAGSTIALGRTQVTEPLLELRDSGEDQAPRPYPLVLPGIELPLELLVDDLQLQRPAWELSGERQQLQALALAGRWRKSALQLDSLRVSSLQWGDASAVGQVEFRDDWPLQLDLQLTAAELPGWPPLLQREINLTAGGSLAGLALRAEVAGTVGLIASAELNALAAGLPFELAADATWAGELRPTQVGAAPDTLAEYGLISPWHLTASGSLANQRFGLKGKATVPGYPPLGLVLAGGHDAGVVKLDDIRLQDVASTNTLRGSGQIALPATPVEPLRWRLDLESAGMSLPPVLEHLSGRVQGTVRASGSSQGPDWQVALAQVNLRGEVNGQSAFISGFANLDRDNLVASSDLRAEVNGARLDLVVEVQEGNAGSLQLAVDDLGRWQPGSKGRLSLQASLGAERKQLAFTGSLDEVDWRGLEFSTARIDGAYTAGADHAFNVDARLAEVTIAGIELDSLEAHAAGNRATQAADLRVLGELQTELVLSGALRGERDWAGQLAPTTVQTPQGTWHLAEAVALAWSGESSRLSVQGHCWQSERTQVCPGDLRLGEEGSGAVDIRGGMEFLALFLPDDIEVKGELGSKLAATWAPAGGLVVDGTITTTDVQVTRHYGEQESDSARWDSATALVRRDGRGLQVNAAMDRDDARRVALALLLPANREDPLSGELTLSKLQLATLAPLAPGLSRLEGELSGTLQLAGNAGQPLASGTLTLAQGDIAITGNPTELKALELVIEAQGDRARLSGKGVLGGGELALEGQLFMRPEPKLELTLRGVKNELLLPPATRALVSETFKMTVTPGQLDITGSVHVHEGVLRQEQLPAGSVALSPDVVEVDYSGNIISQQRTFATRARVTVLIEDNFRIVGDMVNATLGGELQLVQDYGQPLQLFGNLNVIGGELRAYQQLLRIKRGTISFTGRPDNPEFDIRARREIASDNVIVGVQLQGTAQEPLLEVFSDPVMPQGDMMSYLVRGRAMDVGASADAAAMALSLGASAVNRSIVVTELNRIPGVNNLEFGSEGTAEDMSATVGGYIGERLYLSYGMGVYEPVSVLTARLYLQTRLWLEVVSRLENSIDLYYSFDID